MARLPYELEPDSGRRRNGARCSRWFRSSSGTVPPPRCAHRSRLGPSSARPWVWNDSRARRSTARTTTATSATISRAPERRAPARGAGRSQADRRGQCRSRRRGAAARAQLRPRGGCGIAAATTPTPPRCTRPPRRSTTASCCAGERILVLDDCGAGHAARRHRWSRSAPGAMGLSEGRLMAFDMMAAQFVDGAAASRKGTPRRSVPHATWRFRAASGRRGGSSPSTASPGDRASVYPTARRRTCASIRRVRASPLRACG